MSEFYALIVFGHTVYETIVISFSQFAYSATGKTVNT